MRAETRPTGYEYTCNRQEAELLIRWLLDKGYWIEVERRRIAATAGMTYCVNCLVPPREMPATIRDRITAQVE